MSDELTFEEEVSYGCTPPEVLAALARINSRIAQHKLDDPGDYEQTDIAARWMSENLRSNWKLSVTVKRLVPESPAVAIAPPPQNVEKTEETSPKAVVELPVSPPVAVVEKTPAARPKQVTPSVVES